MESSRQMSESVRIGIFLTMAGGFMDAYSYICRGKVFANAQTGNIVLLGQSLAEANYYDEENFQGQDNLTPMDPLSILVDQLDFLT